MNDFMSFLLKIIIKPKIKTKVEYSYLSHFIGRSTKIYVAIKPITTAVDLNSRVLNNEMALLIFMNFKFAPAIIAVLNNDSAHMMSKTDVIRGNSPADWYQCLFLSNVRIIS
jgi:hypothetical protein